MRKSVLFVLLLYVSILSSGQELNYKLDRTSRKYGYTDKTGKWIISPQYDQALEFGKNNLALIKQEGKFGYIRKNGEIVIPFVYENLGEFDDEKPGEMAPACLKGKYGYINSYNKQIIPFQYDYASSFGSGIGYISQEKKYWFINKKGEPISEHKYDLGEVTLEELGNYLFEQVQKQARVINRHTQTPSVTPSPSLGTD